MEIWKTFPKFNGKIEASNLGNFKSDGKILKHPKTKANITISYNKKSTSLNLAYVFHICFPELKNIFDNTIENIKGEIWKDIPGWEGYYQASNLGRIKGMFLFESVGVKTPFMRKTKICTNYVNTSGYFEVSLRKPGEKNVRVSVHRLVAQAFIPNPENKPQVNHIDGSPTNNKLENLEWCTAQENIDHAWKTGLRDNFSKKVSGDNSHFSKLTEEKVREIREVYTGKYGECVALGKEYGVGWRTIFNIVNNRNWTHI